MSTTECVHPDHLDALYTAVSCPGGCQAKPQKTNRRAAGLVTAAAMRKAAVRHARLTLLAAAHAALHDENPITRADARTVMADCHAALDDLRGTVR